MYDLIECAKRGELKGIVFQNEGIYIYTTADFQMALNLENQLLDSHEWRQIEVETEEYKYWLPTMV